MVVIDPWHWLNPDGTLPEEPRLRKRTLRVVRFIEAGGPLLRGEAREVLVECEKRPGSVPCRSLLLVVKTERNEIHAFCTACGGVDSIISNWEGTRWARGLVPPLDFDALINDPNGPMSH